MGLEKAKKRTASAECQGLPDVVLIFNIIVDDFLTIC